MKTFEELTQIDVNKHTEDRNGFTYLSWAYAWDIFKRNNPTATYIVKLFDGKPYIYDEDMGYMVFTEMTVTGITHEMWLPVMNGANKAMKKEKYTYTTKYGDKEVEPASMFDVNKTIMRCLVKNMAMFGLGLYIYAGEDLPPKPDKTPEQLEQEALTAQYQLQRKTFGNETVDKLWKDNNLGKGITKEKLTQLNELIKEHLDSKAKKPNDLENPKSFGDK